MKNRIITYTYFEIIYSEPVIYRRKEKSMLIEGWMTPQEIAGLKRSRQWKHHVSIKKKGTIILTLKL